MNNNPGSEPRALTGVLSGIGAGVIDMMSTYRLASLLHFELDFLRELLAGDYPACDPYHSLKRKAMLASNDMRLRLHERMYLRKLSHWAVAKAAERPSLLVLNGYVSEAAA